MLSSLMADKDVDGYLRRVAPFAAEFIATRADVPRAMDAERLKRQPLSIAPIAEQYLRLPKLLSMPEVG